MPRRNKYRSEWLRQAILRSGGSVGHVGNEIDPVTAREAINQAIRTAEACKTAAASKATRIALEAERFGKPSVGAQ